MKTFYFVAENEHEMNAWMDALEIAADLTGADRVVNRNNAGFGERERE